MGYDFFHLPPSQKADVQVFSPTGFANTAQWQTWEKPRGISFVHIVAVSGGCGGGAGAIGAVSTAADLNEQRIESAIARRADHRGDGRWGGEAGAYNPQGPHIGPG